MGSLISYAAAMAFLALGIELGGEFVLFWDSSAACIVLVAGPLIALAHYGPSGIADAFMAARSHGPATDMAVHYHVLQGARLIFMLLGIVGAFVGLIIFLHFLTNPDAVHRLGPALATSYLSLFYGVFAAEGIMGPLCSRARALGAPNAAWDAPRLGFFYAMVIIPIYFLLVLVVVCLFFVEPL